MKKLTLLCLPILVLSGCASLWKTMGVATEQSVVARNTELSTQLGRVKASVEELAAASSQISALRKDIDQLAPISQDVAALKARVDELSTKVEETNSALAELGQVKELIAELQGRADRLPAETIRKLADILSRAAEELTAAASQ
jgi:TolA-binding protein